eukprot:Colp12_sorted_trinity150504_noHs@25907
MSTPTTQDRLQTLQNLKARRTSEERPPVEASTKQRLAILEKLKDQKTHMSTSQAASATGPQAVRKKSMENVTSGTMPSMQNTQAREQMEECKNKALEQSRSTPGYYCSQDSYYGNFVIPVIPRIDSKTLTF